jgi:hypothetical protein
MQRETQIDADVARIVRYRLMGYSPQRIADLFGLAESYVRGILRLRRLEGDGRAVEPRVVPATLVEQNSP